MRIEDQRGRVHAIEVMVYGWNVLSPIDAVTKMALTVKVVPIQAPESLSWRALVPQARATLAGHACLHIVV